MMNISHFRFRTDLETPYFEQASLEAYQATRTHPTRPIKNRSLMEPPPADFIASRIDLKQTRASHAETLQCITRNPQSRTVTLFANSLVKMIGYNVQAGDTVATTGTSKLKTLCITDGMGPCIGVAIGGEKLNLHGVPSFGAKVRVFHVFPWNLGAPAELRAYIEKLQGWGLSVRAAMHGGALGGVIPEISVWQSRMLRALFLNMNVQLDMDETCERRDDCKPMGVIIDVTHAVRFVTNLKQGHEFDFF